MVLKYTKKIILWLAALILRYTMPHTTGFTGIGYRSQLALALFVRWHTSHDLYSFGCHCSFPPSKILKKIFSNVLSQPRQPPA